MMVYFLALISMSILFFANRSDHVSVYKTIMTGDNPLTSHVLDTGRGVPAPGIKTTLSIFQESIGLWKELISKDTNEDGRLGHLLTDAEFNIGIYKLKFETKSYFKKLGIKTFYPYIEIVFEIEDPNEHYHVPILLSPYGFTTYRGS